MRFAVLFLTIFCISASQADDSEVYVKHIYQAIKNNPTLFNTMYPSSTFEEVSDSLKNLESWLRYLKREQAIDNFLFPGLLPKWKVITKAKKKRIKQMAVLAEKINEFKAIRKKLKPQLSLKSRCALFFQKKFTSSTSALN